MRYDDDAAQERKSRALAFARLAMFSMAALCLGFGLEPPRSMMTEEAGRLVSTRRHASWNDAEFSLPGGGTASCSGRLAGQFCPAEKLEMVLAAGGDVTLLHRGARIYEVTHRGEKVIPLSATRNRQWMMAAAAVFFVLLGWKAGTLEK